MEESNLLKIFLNQYFIFHFNIISDSYARERSEEINQMKQWMADWSYKNSSSTNEYKTPKVVSHKPLQSCIL